jgi:signal transduction histidine kinase
MSQEILSFLANTPYSIPNIIGFFLLVQSIVFFEVSKRSKDDYSLLLSIGLFLLAIAWGTTEYQNTGKLYVDWKWWWAQPFFAFGILYICVAVIRYLPLEYSYKEKLFLMAIIFPMIYIIVGTVSLLVGFQIQRAYIIWMQLPPFIAISLATFKAENYEPKKGHRVIGLLALVVPVLSVVYPLLGLKTAVLRFWTAVPLLTLAAIVLAASLLREREKIQETLDDLKVSDDQLQALNKNLEAKVISRTAMLNDIITDLESFNRSVSHDLRSPLGSISVIATVAEKYLSMGKHQQVAEELKTIKQQVDGLHALVGTMLNLASHVESTPKIEAIKFQEFVTDRIDRSMIGFVRNHPNLSAATFEIDDLGVIQSNIQLFGIIIDNLIDNAIKYNANKSNLKIKISGDYSDDKLILFVRDNGIGINKDIEAKEVDIYMPFMRVNENKETQGYGLGLNIVRRAVKKLGGEVWFEPTEGGGVTFFFSLPK